MLPETTSPATTEQHSRAEISRTCLEAHQTLMGLNPANVAKFKDVAQFLAEDVKRLEAEGAAASTKAAETPAS